MKSKTEMKCLLYLFLGENQHFIKKIIHFFVIGQVKFLQCIVFFYLSCFKFDVALFNLHISCRVYL